MRSPLLAVTLLLTGCSSLSGRNGAVGGVNYLSSAHEEGAGYDKHIDGCRLGAHGEIIMSSSNFLGVRNPVVTVFPDGHALLRAPGGDVSFAPSDTAKVTLATDANGRKTGSVRGVYDEQGRTLNLGVEIHECGQ